MLLRIIGHSFHYEMENLCRVFFPSEKIKTVYDEKSENEEKTITTLYKNLDNVVEIEIQVNLGDSKKIVKRFVDVKNNDNKQECELQMSTALFIALTDLTGYVPSWGVLTGVRPSKLMTNLIKQYGQDFAQSYFHNSLLVSNEKTELSISVANSEKKIIDTSDKNCFSLYVAIPFCPSRCSYCSFVSHSITAPNAIKLLPEYIANLCYELEIVGRIAKQLKIRPQTIYFGGGTPTSLNSADLLKLCETIRDNFDLTDLEEYTVEAGRPDTITAGKLSVLKNNGVTRISINPQTFNDRVLEIVGRKHTTQCTLESFNLARLSGFENINMDLIAGLPTDSLDSFISSLNASINLSPENITMHTLALKRSSTLVTQGDSIFQGETASKMLISAQNNLQRSGYHPYYMYRQSRSLGNLENIGWCKPGFECIYNVFMMEECQTVLAVGAGAVTKLKQINGNYIERIFNFKYPYEYNSRFDEIIERKKGILEFYYKFNI